MIIDEKRQYSILINKILNKIAIIFILFLFLF